jgi:hypothetical protein
MNFNNPNGHPLYIMSNRDEKPEFEWNKEFIKLTNQGVCPYCGEILIINGITKECNCQFYILGAVETLAYTIRETSKKAPIINDNICPECNNTDFKYDNKHDETYCISCGLTLEGPPGYAGYIPIFYPKGHNFDTGEIHKF